MGSRETLNIAYGILIAMIGYLAVKGFRNRKKIGNNPQQFQGRPKPFTLVISILLAVFGAIEGKSFIGIALVVMGVYFVAMSFPVLIFGDKGIYSQGIFDEWNSVQKWDVDREARKLTLLVKSSGKDMKREFGFRDQDGQAIQSIIKRYKKKKK
jgi:hypothetical protein